MLRAMADTGVGASDQGEGLVPGLYESVVTRRMADRLARHPDLTTIVSTVDKADSAGVLGRHIHAAAMRALQAMTEPKQQLDLVARLLEVVGDLPETPEPGPRQLLSVAPSSQWDRSVVSSPVRPSTPLSDAALLTNASGDPALGAELRRELATADGVDLLCAFVQWHGLRVLEAELAELSERKVPFRVITTTYLGGTERKALDRLVSEFGAQVRVQYDAQRTRLHAKAWLLRRNSGFDTAYVGSSNLSRSALLDGAEWNVRLSRIGTPGLLGKFEATFDSYWNSDQYERYDPALDRDRFDDAVAGATSSRRTDSPIRLSGLHVRPFPHQAAILEALQAERRVHDRHANLVVAATGTGKTIIAALDYKQVRAGWEASPAREPSLLFVAHRREILQQSIRAYREVLVDASFGEEFVGGVRPERWRHVFASVQSLTSYDVRNIPADAFDVVVIDEFHHAEAQTYRRILDHLKPRELLGLTATPERADGTDVRAFFDYRTAAELRLWDAIDSGLLTPFHYFGVSDGTDLRRLAWRAGQYDARDLDAVYTGNDARASIVLQQVRDKILDPGRMRALGFCVSVDHARYMARVFEQAGLAARALHADTRQDERDAAFADLRAGRVQALFAVDLFNEGLDLPEVDVVLMLRPTQSATIFLQQLGRGLRITEDKPVLTVLDFVGLHRAEFALEMRFRTLTRTSRKNLEREVASGFPFLPSGCQIVLDEHTQTSVLKSIRTHLHLRKKHLVEALRLHPTDALGEYLREAGFELADVIREQRGGSFTTLRREAGLIHGDASPLESVLAKRVRALAHVDDPLRAAAYESLLGGIEPRNALEERLARMLYFTFFPNGKHESYDAGLADVRRNTELTRECVEVVRMGLDATRHSTELLGGPLAGIPLATHASYSREEALAALGYAHLQRVPSGFREGVLHVNGELGPVDALFITLRKSEAEYSPTTMYADYPISPTRFHWESQSTTSVASKTGQRYLTGASTVLLFVRREKRGELGTAPYVLLGPARYVSHRGERPIAITWELETPMPADLYAASAVAV